MGKTPIGAPLSAAERAALEAKLRAHRDELRAEIAVQLKNQDDPRLVGLRNRMEDTDDWAAADAMAAMDIASVSRVLAILADVEAAFAAQAKSGPIRLPATIFIVAAHRPVSMR